MICMYIALRRRGVRAISAKENSIQIRMSDEEKERVKREADYLGLSMSDYMRMKSLEFPIQDDIKEIKEGIKRLENKK